MYKLKLQLVTSTKYNVHVFIYEKSKTNFETFLYTKSSTFGKKQEIFRYVLYTKSMTLYVTWFFMKIFKFAFIYKKNDTIRYMTFLYTKIETLRKKQDNLHYVFIFKNPDTLRHAIYIEFLKLAEGGSILICKK